MNYQQKAARIADNILFEFRSGTIAEPLSVIFLSMDSDGPMYNWSVKNLVPIIALGFTDARGYNQWRDVNRYVRKGESSRVDIMVPRFQKKDPDDPDSPKIKKGYLYVPVFDISQTDGEPLPVTDVQKFLAERPLIEVAEHWGLDVLPLLHDPTAKGTYDGRAIRLRVANLSTWLHELVHAADDRAGNLKEMTNTWANETVAELGQCVLSRMIGADVLDDGKAWRYISRYAKESGIEPIKACEHVLERVSTAVGLIMQTANELDLSSDFFQTAQVETQLAHIGEVD